MRNLAELRLNELGDPVERRSPSSKTISEFEKEFDLMLPNDYRYFLSRYNGGHPESDSIITKNHIEMERVSVDHFLHLDEDRLDPSSLWIVIAMWRRVLNSNYLPFAVDGGGNPFVLDLATVPPAVYICLHDKNFSLTEVSSSFSEFIDNLEINTEMI